MDQDKRKVQDKIVLILVMLNFYILFEESSLFQ